MIDYSCSLHKSKVPEHGNNCYKPGTEFDVYNLFYCAGMPIPNKEDLTLNIRSVMGTKKTVVFVALVVAMATVSGVIYGNIIS